MSSEATASARLFFDTYRAAFEARDAAAITDRFAYPCHVTSDTGEIALATIPSRRAGLATVEQLLAMYERIGVAAAHLAELAVTSISPALMVAAVHWTLDDRAGERLYDFEAAYTLGSIEGEWRITALAHDELPRYRECLARREGAGKRTAG